MSLLDSSYENFTVLNKIVTDDGYGGVTTVWTTGATIKGNACGTGNGRNINIQIRCQKEHIA